MPFYLAMSYNAHTSITSGFSTYDDAFKYLAAVARHHLELEDNVEPGFSEDMDDREAINEFFDECAENANWIITDAMLEPKADAFGIKAEADADTKRDDP